MTSKFSQFGREIKSGIILVFSLLILFSSFTLNLQGEEKEGVIPKEIASEETKDPLPEQAKRRNFNIKIGIHYFSPSGQSLKDVYGSGVCFRAEATIFVLRNFAFWVGGSYFHKNGMLTFTEEETKLTIFPLGGGIKYRKLFGDISLYLGIGLNYYQFKESNPIGDVSKGGLGYIGLLGGSVKLTEGLLLDLYSNYSYCKMTPVDFEIDVGGLEIGIGLIYEF
jgi:hypothetical protein